MKCEYCSKEHNGEYGSGRFCSVECAKGFSTKEKRKEINQKVSEKLRKSWPKEKLERCLTCNKILYNNQVKFCTIECSIEYKRLQTNKKIVEGKIKNTDALKRYLKGKYGDFCSKCGQNNSGNGMKLNLQLDHIDGDTDNNVPSDIRLLCPNCHSQTRTFCRKKKYINNI